jgi:hypothetical protein
MKAAIVAMIVATLSACASPNAIKPEEKYAEREFTDTEKQALAASLAESLTDPDARFKWMPVLLRPRPDGVTDYCGLVNGKNSFGAYSGYSVFYAWLRTDDTGRYGPAELRLVADGVPTQAVVANICADYGYIDFGRAR